MTGSTIGCSLSKKKFIRGSRKLKPLSRIMANKSVESSARVNRHIGSGPLGLSRRRALR